MTQRWTDPEIVLLLRIFTDWIPKITLFEEDHQNLHSIAEQLNNIPTPFPHRSTQAIHRKIPALLTKFKKFYLRRRDQPWREVHWEPFHSFNRLFNLLPPPPDFLAAIDNNTNHHFIQRKDLWRRRCVFTLLQFYLDNKDKFTFAASDFRASVHASQHLLILDEITASPAEIRLKISNLTRVHRHLTNNQNNGRFLHISSPFSELLNQLLPSGSPS